MTDESITQHSPSGESWWMSRQTRAFAATILAPLGSDESDAAARVALDAVVAGGSVRAERLTAYPPQIRLEKPPRRDEAPRRLVWVRVRDSDRQVVHEIGVVDGVVVSHEVNEHGSPPVTDDERTAARRLLENDRRFRDVLADDSVEIEWFSPGHGHDRLVGARLVRVDGTRVIDVVDSAAVDLDNSTILEGGDLNG
jgi:hypothetical protein